MRGCNGRWKVRYGDHVEIYCESTGNLLASFKVLRDMCEESFNFYLAVRYGVTVPYRMRKIK